MITSQISLFAFYAARVILFLLLFISILIVGFFIERLFYFRRNTIKNEEELLEKLGSAKSRTEVEKILIESSRSESTVVLRGLESVNSADQFRERVRALLNVERKRWERFGSFLGSVGSNAPFVGLLGTVLGIMKSFADLGAASKGGPQVVMAGISEALIATAVGLGVAIPAIIFFNICRGRSKRSVGAVESLVSMIVSRDLFRED